MILMFLQTLPGICLVAAAFYVQASSRIRKRYGSLHEIIRDFDALDGRLASLSHHDLLSNGLAIEEGDVWDHIGRWHGLIAMHRNAGLFIAALDWIEHEFNCPTAFFRSSRIVRTSACALRLLIYASFATCSVRAAFGLERGNCVETARRYISVRARFALVVQDYRGEQFDDVRRSLAGLESIYG